MFKTAEQLAGKMHNGYQRKKTTNKPTKFNNKGKNNNSQAILRAKTGRDNDQIDDYQAQKRGHTKSYSLSPRCSSRPALKPFTDSDSTTCAGNAFQAFTQRVKKA